MKWLSQVPEMAEVEVYEHCDINGCPSNFAAVHLFEGSFCKQQPIKSLNSLEAVAGASGGRDIQIADIKLVQSPFLLTGKGNLPK